MTDNPPPGMTPEILENITSLFWELDCQGYRWEPLPETVKKKATKPAKKAAKPATKKAAKKSTKRKRK